ncbi:MAG TPA: phage integrase SAM-like domain-containing protein, partial [Bacteroidia bacterium]|nr:phage integrase SAM-like domain-containing protein [Bacteroidia bacterium]
MSEIKFRLELNDKPNKEGLYEVFIIIRENGKRQKVKTEVFCKNEYFGTWKSVSGSKTKKRALTWGKWITSKDKEATYKNNQLEKKLNSFRKTYNEKKEVFGYVSKEQVITAVKAPYNLKNIIDYMDKCIKEYGEADNYQNQKGYVTAKNHLVEFIKANLKRDSLDFREIDKAFLQKYEKYLLSKKITKEKKTRSIGSVHTIMKRLRAIFNDAISEGIITPDIYPFKIYQLPTIPKTYKERLSSEELEQFENLIYEPTSFKFVTQKA